MLYDMTARDAAARDRIEMLRRDFQMPRRSARAALGRRLVHLGLRLAGDDVRVVYSVPQRPSEAYP